MRSNNYQQLFMICSFLAVVLQNSLSLAYSIQCLALDFDCGSIDDTMANICQDYNDFIPSRKRRSLSPYPNPTTSPLGSSTTERTITKELISEEEASTMLKTNPRFRRSTRKSVYSECCQSNNNGGLVHYCSYTEVVEYCINTKNGIYNCSGNH